MFYYKQTIMEEHKSNNNLVLSGIVIESRESDKFINATQLCKAGGKRFGDWYSLDSTKELIRTLEESIKSDTKSSVSLIDIKKGNTKLYTQGSWIHPDLAVPLAQWISPSFAIQVSRWIRELFITGSVSINSRKTDEELKELQYRLEESERKFVNVDEQHKKELEQISKQLYEKDRQLKEKDNLNFTLKNFVENVKMKEILYLTIKYKILI